MISGQLSGLVFDVQRFSLHDGPGIRTTVFLKGCPLACRWCHNPEGMTTAPEILVSPDRCIGCGACVDACPHGLPSGIAGGWVEGEAGSRSAKDLCKACGLCAEACPTEARRLAGREVTVQALVDEVLRDRVFYENSGGGVTFSGGEPLRQAKFVLACLAALKERGVHTAVDTCGLVDEEDLLRAAELADLFLFDIKHADEAAHTEWAGAPNDRILSNLRVLAAGHAAIWVRVPVVPGVNDDDANLRHTAALAASLPGVQRVSLLPYHELGSGKREGVGTSGEPFRAHSPNGARMRDIATLFETEGLHTVIGG